MSSIRLGLAGLFTAILSFGHPMGNFSVNHYAKFQISQQSAQLTYVLDLAEIPTFEFLQKWNIDGRDLDGLRAKAEAQAHIWIGHLSVTDDRVVLRPNLVKVDASTQPGAGGMPVLRVSMQANLPIRAGRLQYEDQNFPGRAGWKEIVISPSEGASVRDASLSSKDLSKGLTVYPADLTSAPPQDLSASFVWTPLFPSKPALAETPAAPSHISPAIAQGKGVSTPPAHTPFLGQKQSGPGAITRGDFLSSLLLRRDISLGLILIGLTVAFGLGATHALSPGHGKTIVAAYLIGNRGTLKHAALLGFLVTFTHTFTVFLLGLGVLFFQEYIVPEKIMPILGAVSGLSIVLVGASLLYKRSKALLASGAEHAHHHSHDHGSDHHHHSHTAHNDVHSHAHELDEHHHHDHSHAGLHVHSHGGKLHSHVPEGRITLASLITLGISGGLVPCPSALVLMLSAIALGHTALGLILLLAFSMGLAFVLMAIGGLVVYAKNKVPSGKGIINKPVFRLVPIFSAVVVICLGLGMTAFSLGWVRTAIPGV
jgi:nickel/cobalt transporter (NicO) family protein